MYLSHTKRNVLTGYLAVNFRRERKLLSSFLNLMTSDQGTSGTADLQLATQVTPKSQGLNPNANVFQSCKQVDGSTWGEPDLLTSPVVASYDGYPMNGDISKYHSGVVFPPTPDSSPMQVLPTDFTQNSETMQLTPTESGSYPITPPQGEAAGTVSTDDRTLDKQIPLEELKQLLQQQLEYYFSRENLASDSYLLSQMDSDQYVPIWTIANFNQVKKLTSDISLIVDVLRQSPFVKVDEKGEKVKPNHKRCVVILREIPDETTVDEIKNLFDSEKCPKVAHCEFAHNNSWYVTFESDEDAQKAYCYLREEIKTFAGKPILARIKAKPLARSVIVPKNGYKLMSPLGSSVYQPTTVTVTQSQASSPSGQQSPHSQTQIFTQPTSTSYASGQVPMDGYSGQQQFPFYPPNMLPTAWQTSPPLFDPGMAFVANGFAPQATFKPTSPSPHQGQQGFHIISRNRNRSGHRSSNNDRSERNSFDYGRPSYDRYSNTSSSHSRSSYISQRSYSDSSTYRDKSESIHSRGDGHSPNYGIHVGSHHTLLTERKQDGEAQTTALRVLETKDVMGQPIRSHRRRRREADTAEIPVNSTNSAATTSANATSTSRTTKNSFSQTATTNASTSTTAKDGKPGSPTFALESSSFPPLPGATPATKAEDVFESRIADVVKGTAKPLTRDSKTQTPLSPTLKDSATLTNGDIQSHSPLSSSPTKVTKASSTQSKPAATPEKHTKSEDETSAVSTKSIAATATSSSKLPRENKHVLSHSNAVHHSKVSSMEIHDKSHHQSAVPLNDAEPGSQLHLEEKGPTKLSYAQMVQRAREKAEKQAEKEQCDKESKDKANNREKEKPKEPISTAKITLKETSRILRDTREEQSRHFRDSRDDSLRSFRDLRDELSRNFRDSRDEPSRNLRDSRDYKVRSSRQYDGYRDWYDRDYDRDRYERPRYNSSLRSPTK